MSFTYITLTAGTGYRDATGATPAARIRARPLVTMTNGTTVVHKEVVIPLAADGVATRTLAATTDPLTTPAGNGYRFVVEVGGQVVRTFTAAVPHDAGATVDLEDLADLVSPPSLTPGATVVSVDGLPVSTLSIDSTAITATDVGADPAGTAAAIITPPGDHSFLAWAYDPAVVAGSTILTAGVIYLTRIRVPAATTIAGVAMHVSTAGVTLANSFMGLYDASGTRLGVTADQSTGFASGGLRSASLTAPVGVAAGQYYVAVVTNGTTQPTMTRGPNSSAINLNLAAPTLRWATFGTSQTSLPSTINLSSSAASSLAFWAGLT